MKTTAAVIGLVLNILGVSLAGWALRQDYRKHAHKPLVPWAAAREWFLVKVLRQTRSTRVHGGAAEGIFTLSASATGIVVPADDAPVDSQIAYLRDQVMTLHSMLGELGRKSSAEIGKVDQAVREARKDAQDAVTSVEEMARDIATGTVKIQLFGLLLMASARSLLHCPSSSAGSDFEGTSLEVMPARRPRPIPRLRADEGDPRT